MIEHDIAWEFYMWLCDEMDADDIREATSYRDMIYSTLNKIAHDDSWW